MHKMDEYTKERIAEIKTAKTDDALERIVNGIYEDGVNDGVQTAEEKAVE